LDFLIKSKKPGRIRILQRTNPKLYSDLKNHFPDEVQLIEQAFITATEKPLEEFILFSKNHSKIGN